MKPLTSHPAVDGEVLAAAYEGQRNGLGREFREEFDAALDRIRRMPGVSATIDDQGTRKHRLRRFPYTIFYVEFPDVIWIVAVSHQRRRPGYWAGRDPSDAGD